MTDTPDPKRTATKTKYRGLKIFVVVAVFGAMPLIAVFWMYPAWESQQVFEEAKITIAHLDGEPFMRIDLRPGQSYRPIELMARTRVAMDCEVVSLKERMNFVFTAFGRKTDGPTCEYTVEVPDEPGLHSEVVFKFFDGSANTPTDVLRVPVVVVSHGERLEFHGLEDDKGNDIGATSVGGRVVVYGRAIVKEIPDYKKLVPLFFVADSLDGRPVLQLNPEREAGDPPYPLTGQMVLYRNYGERIRGYALWSRNYLTVGGPKDHRKVFDIYFGFFEKARLDEVFEKTLAVEWTGKDSVRVRPLVSSVQKLKEMTYEGRFLSPPFHVVRGTSAVDSGLGK